MCPFNQNEFGSINIKHEVIAKVAGLATTETYGIVGMSSQKKLKDEMFELLKKENSSKGVTIREDEDGLHIDLHVIVMYGVKVKEVTLSVQEKVLYELHQGIGIPVQSVNVFVNGIRFEESTDNA